MTSDQVGCIIGVEAAALRMELRAAIGAPNASFTSCAVVGSSGSLLSDRHGQEIDQHDAVIRFNTAPVRGFEPVVGSRTTVRLVNGQAMVSVIKRCSPYGTCTPNVTCCSDPHETLFINSGRDGVAGDKSGRCVVSFCDGNGGHNVLSCVTCFGLREAGDGGLDRDVANLGPVGVGEDLQLAVVRLTPDG